MGLQHRHRSAYRFGAFDRSSGTRQCTSARDAPAGSLQIGSSSSSANIPPASGVHSEMKVKWSQEACERLRKGTNVTDAVPESGFKTKSKFNRGFLRVAGQPPRK